jgi:hypothetical protein
MPLGRDDLIAARGWLACCTIAALLAVPTLGVMPVAAVGLGILMLRRAGRRR